MFYFQQIERVQTKLLGYFAPMEKNLLRSVPIESWSGKRKSYTTNSNQSHINF
jgi:hypothetical protein